MVKGDFYLVIIFVPQIHLKPVRALMIHETPGSCKFLIKTMRGYFLVKLTNQHIYSFYN